MVGLSKFTSNKKILSGIVTLGYNKVGWQTLSQKHSEVGIYIFPKKRKKGNWLNKIFFWEVFVKYVKSL